LLWADSMPLKEGKFELEEKERMRSMLDKRDSIDKEDVVSCDDHMVIK